MCGIGGYVLRDLAPTVPEAVDRFLGALRTRGPDDEGVVLVDRPDGVIRHCRTDRSAPALAPHLEPLTALRGVRHNVAIVNARFAIADRRAEAHQPFVSRCGTVVGAFHGEIYNYPELGRELEAAGVALRTRGDTEVLIEGYRLWGDALWPRLNGFWAVLLYDGRTRRVVISRDRLGVAPLYVRETAQGIFFASTIRPLIAADPAPVHVHPAVLAGFIDTELKDVDAATCFQEIQTFPAATTLTLAGDTPVADGRHSRYWAVPAAPLRPAD
ncbi:MAG: hypothetical protein OEX21_14220, partial [Betaproteobacteria bacterium]|nr:hypothetical protein [Betaproteobacteria bacterium]